MIAPRPLNERTLRHHAARVSVPSYDRAALRRGVVHMSVGSFHRSHQAVYFDALAERGLGDGWGLTGVGVRRRDMQRALAPQDGLYTVVARGRDADTARIVGVITRYIYAPEQTGQLLDALAAEHVRLVTLTITADGYNVDPCTGAFAPCEPDVVADLAGQRHPRSVLGYLVEALDRRRRAGRAPFTVLSCDNMPGNGAIARAALVSFARRRDEDLGGWIDEHVAFPSSMVDRITPKTTPQDREFVARTFGVSDRWPVLTEPFSQWIVEDAFCHGRPPLEEVGVQFVSDVTPYSLTKTRLLNGSHSALGYLGSLAGYDRTDEAIGDPAFDGYVERLMRDEIAPLLPAIPAIDVPAYRAALRERLANPAVGDRLSRLCRNGSTKVARHVLSTIREARAAGRPHELLTLAVAGWCRHLRGIDEQGRAIVLDDPAAHRLRQLALAGGTDPRPLLREREIFGSLADDRGFADALARDLRLLDAVGARQAVAERITASPEQLEAA